MSEKNERVRIVILTGEQHEKLMTLLTTTLAERRHTLGSLKKVAGVPHPDCHPDLVTGIENCIEDAIRLKMLVARAMEWKL